MDEDTKRRDLLRRLLEDSPYRRRLRDQADEIVRVALGNDAVCRALDRILADPDYASGGRLNRRRLAGPHATIRHLLEWVFFASGSFVERARRG